MSFEEAITDLGSDIIVDIEVTPGSKSVLVPSGYNEWRKRIEGLADLFKISSSDILINSGATSSKKSLLLKGVSYQRAISIFGACLRK